MADEYGRIAAVYDLLLNPVMDPLRRRVVSLLKTNGVESVLDMCCGTGRQAFFLHLAGMEVTGADRSPAMLAQARRKTHQDIAYLLEDASSLSLPDKAVDSVILSMALHEMPRVAQLSVLDEAVRISRKYLIVVDYVLSSTFMERRALCLARLPEWAAGRRHYAMFQDFLSRGGLAGLLKEKGLAVMEARPVFFGAGRLMLCRVD